MPGSENAVPRPLRLLLVEDSPDDAELLKVELEQQGFGVDIKRVDTRELLLEALTDGRIWDIVVSDHNLPELSSMDTLSIVKGTAPDLPVIVVSGSIGEEYAVEAMRSGASDFIVKTKLHRLAPALERELRDAEQRREQLRTAAALQESEERLRQSQKLEAIGRLAGGIAHDFNNLLTAILGYADLALASVPTGHALRADLEEIKLAGKRAVDLTKQLLAFSRRQVLQRRVLHLGDVIEGVVRLLRRVIGEDVKLETSSAPGLWHVIGDLTQIEQIIMNLAVNARDAMSRGGTLRINTANFVAGGSGSEVFLRPGEYVRLTVSDTGEGIPDSVKGRIFEPFFTTKEPGRGTGLGLATVYGIVQQSGGLINMESEVGRGTTFTIYLPRTTQAVGEEDDLPEVIPRSGNETILLVEDEGSVRELAGRVLSDAGYHVVSVPDPQTALATAAGYGDALHLLVTDVVMPGMSGPDLATELRRTHKDLGVLFISGFSGEAMPALEPFGEHAFLAKPFAPANLVSKVREVLTRRGR